ncbi:MAG: hypothetical protein PVI40_03165 [Chlamydiota bacterium]|jgi:hypothetical protein
MKVVYFLFILVILSVFSISTYGNESSYFGIAYYDKEPWKIAWANKQKKEWELTASFQQAHITFYFKEGPSNQKGLNLSPENLPYKIEFRDLTSNKLFIIKEIVYEQWDDGAKTFAGRCEKKFKRDDEEFNAIVVSIVEEIDGKANYADYWLFKA